MTGLSFEKIESIIKKKTFKRAIGNLNILENIFFDYTDGKELRIHALSHPKNWKWKHAPSLVDLRLLVEMCKEPTDMDIVTHDLEDCKTLNVQMEVERTVVTSKPPIIDILTIHTSELECLAEAMKRINRLSGNSSCIDVAIDVADGTSNASNELNLVAQCCPNLLRHLKSLITIHNNDSLEVLARFEVLKLYNSRYRNCTETVSALKTAMSLAIGCSHTSDNIKQLLSSTGMIFSPNKTREMCRTALEQRTEMTINHDEVMLLIIDNFNRLTRSRVRYLEHVNIQCAAMVVLGCTIKFPHQQTSTEPINTEHEYFKFNKSDSSKTVYPDFQPDDRKFHLFDHFQLLTVLNAKSSSAKDYVNNVLPVIEKLGDLPTGLF